MKILVLSVVLTLAANAAAAACFVDYKAKRDDPLRLHYGVMRLSDAECADAERAVQRRLNSAGWTLLTVMDRFGRAEARERESDAGDFYLRY